VIKGRPTGAGVAALIAAGLTACGGASGESLPPAQVAKIEDTVATVAAPTGHSPGKATCPDEIPAQKGEEFECKVKAEGKTGTYQVKLSDAKGSAITYEGEFGGATSRGNQTVFGPG
jgi:Domain of unknown function (DUF4333)